MNEPHVSEWVAWRRKEKPGDHCLVPADVGIVSLNGKVSHLSRTGFSPLIPLRSLPVRPNPESLKEESWQGTKLLREFEPAG